MTSSQSSIKVIGSSEPCPDFFMKIGNSTLASVVQSMFFTGSLGSMLDMMELRPLGER